MVGRGVVDMLSEIKLVCIGIYFILKGEYYKSRGISDMIINDWSLSV
jgi:hypothetical protein